MRSTPFSFRSASVAVMPRSMLRTVALAMLLSACSGLASDPTTADVPVASVELNVGTLTLAEGSTAALQVTARDADNRPLPERSVVWSSSDTAVARVSVAGLVTAVRTGSAQLSASVDGKSATAQLLVLARTVASVQITPATPRLLVGGFLQLTARTLDESGGALANRPVLWSSSEAGVVVVDANGLLTGIAPGVATVTATSESRSATVGVTVSPVPVASVQLLPLRDTIIVGQSTQLTATPLDSAGVRLDELVTFTTSAASIASVSSVGLVQAIAPGTATITARSGARSSTAAIVVLARPVGAVIVSPATSTNTVGQTLRLVVQITDANGNLLSGRPIAFSSSDVTVARVATDGTVTMVAPGTVTIRVTSEGRTGEASITVLPSPIATLRITPATATLNVGATTRLSVTALDAAGIDLGQRAVTWTSGAPSILTVSVDGTVTALGAGTALVFAASEGRRASATVTVRAITAATLTLSPGTSTLTVGGSVDLVAEVRDAGGQLLTNRTIRWSSNDPTVAVVSSTGRVRAVSPGTARIDGTVDSVTASMVVTSLPVPIASVSVSLVSSQFVGQSAIASAVLRDAQNNVLSGRAVSWSSSNPTIAAVSAGNGVVTGVGPGTATITATSEGRTGSANITIALVPVATVTVSLANTSLIIGGTTQATAVTRDAAGTQLTGRGIAYSSSNSAVATVNAATGLVTAVAPGVVNIRATSEGQTGQASLAVALPPVATVTVSIGSNALFVGGTTQASAVLRDATNAVLTGRSIVWSSSDPSVATVNAGSGLVTAVAPGSANITATSEGKSAQAGVTVTVAPVASVAVSLNAPTVVIGTGSQANATLRDAQNNVLTGRVIVWSSSNPAVATVDASSGQVTTVSPGTTNIVATSEGVSGQATLTVTPPPVAAVAVTLGSQSLFVGSTSQASAVTRDASNNVLTGRVITWSSSDPAVATVSANGLVTAVSAGSVNIIATSEGVAGQATLTSTQLPVNSVTVSLSSPLSAGSTTQATAVTRDFWGNVLTGRVITWSSFDPRIATIDANTGVVTAVSVGTTDIVATSEGKTGLATITVTPVAVATVSIALGASTIAVSATTQATAATRDAQGNLLTGRAVVFASDDPAIATVDANSGLVTAVAAGTVTIRATSEGKTGTVTLTVIP